MEHCDDSSLVQCADCCNEQEDEEIDGDDNATWDPSKLIPCSKDISHSKDSINDQEKIQTEEKEDSANDFSKDKDPVQTEIKEEKGTISTCVTHTSPNLCIPDVSVYASSDCTNITGITDDDDEEFRMLIAGIRGVGKSALANSIAGSEIQDSKADFGTVTKMATKIKRKLNDRSLIYFDTPGLSKDMEEGRVVEEYKKCLVKAAPGLHAILIVQKATTFTDDNHHFLETFTKIFGENSLKFVLFVFTHIDELDEDLKVQLENGDTRLHEWLKKCDGRYIGINNMILGHKNQQQILRLLSAVDSLVKKNNEKIYTNEEYQKIYEMMKKAAQSRNVTVQYVREQYVREHYADRIIQQRIQQVGTVILREFFNAIS